MLCSDVTFAAAAKKGDCKFQLAVDGRLHHQLFWPNPVQGHHTTSVSPGVLQCHRDLLPMVKWYA